MLTCPCQPDAAAQNLCFEESVHHSLRQQFRSTAIRVATVRNLVKRTLIYVWHVKINEQGSGFLLNCFFDQVIVTHNEWICDVPISLRILTHDHYQGVRILFMDGPNQLQEHCNGDGNNI